MTGPCCLTDAERHVCHFSPKQQVVTLPFLSVIYLSLRDKHVALVITEVSSPYLHELMSTNIRSFHIHLSIGTLCLLKSISSTRCLQASQLIWSTKPWHSSGKGWHPLLDYKMLKNWRFNRKCSEIGLRYGNRIWGITLRPNSLLQVYRKLPYPIPVVLGIRYDTVPVAFSTMDTVPYPQTLRFYFSVSCCVTVMAVLVTTLVLLLLIILDSDNDGRVLQMTIILELTDNLWHKWLLVVTRCFKIKY